MKFKWFYFRLFLSLSFIISFSSCSCRQSNTPEFATVSPPITSTKADRVILHEELVNLKKAPKTYRKLVLENSKIKISILPELGGRIYEFILKESGHNQFYQNTIWKRVKEWGINSCRDGGWLTIGGLEFSFPRDEHGCIYDELTQIKVTDSADGSKTLEIIHPPNRDSQWMSLTNKITLRPGQDYFELSSRIYNPPTNPTQKYQYWINAMLNPGGLDPREADLQILFSRKMKTFRAHYGSTPGMQVGKEYPWTAEYEHYDRWKNGILGLFTTTSPRFLAIISSKADEGILRIFLHPTFTELWNVAPPIGYEFFSNTNRFYIEAWTGITPDFSKDAELSPGSSLEVTELWSAFRTPNLTKNLRAEVEAKVQQIVPAK